MIIMNTNSVTQKKVYKMYQTHIDGEQQNIISEPQVMYASSFNDMLEVAEYDKDFAAGLLDLSYKTVTRYQKEKKTFSPLQSEYIIKTITLFHKGEEVFGTTESFKRWLDKPAFGLGNKIPRNIITTVSGINFVMDELNRIERGDLA